MRGHDERRSARWNRGAPAEPGAEAVPGLVRAQAALRPEALAVAGLGRELTYGELVARAERVGRALRTLGVGSEVVVGLCLKRSPAMVVGALGILNAGAAYLPLDPASPRARLAFLLDDAGPPVVVTTRCLAERLPAGERRLVLLDEDGWPEGPDAPELAAPPVEHETLAYVIYTSGSTGQPKGVQITHGGLLNLTRWHQRAFAVSARDRATQIASIGFDAAVWELWPYLTAGASVHIPDEAIRQDPEALREWLVSERITLTFLPTPLAERMITLPWPADTPLRAMLTGADTLHHRPSPDLPFRLVNNYGPTECTVVATSGPVSPDDGTHDLPTIGRPIDNTEIHILDDRLQPVTPGAAGELHIGGAGLARGYLNRPELTAQKFIQHPFDPQRGARLYKTGDLARLLPDGQVAFLGRVDDQIKVRGYRVEPAEIVTALDEHPAIQESVVVAREVAPGDKRLVAYVVPVPGSQASQPELRNFLADRLPDYMVPASFVVLETLPLNASGKVDRGSLPAPEEAVTIPETVFVAPRTPVEERVAQILAPLLGLQRVGVLDNFFMLGGHSMLGTQLIARLREVFSVELALRTLFETPTVAGLSGEIERLLLEKLHAMEDDEAERMLVHMQEPPSGRGQS